MLGLFLVRARSRPEMRLVATDDLRRTAPGGVLERVMGNEYRVVGDIEEPSDRELVLDVGVAGCASTSPGTPTRRRTSRAWRSAG